MPYPRKSSYAAGPSVCEIEGSYFGSRSEPVAERGLSTTKPIRLVNIVPALSDFPEAQLPLSIAVGGLAQVERIMIKAARRHRLRYH
jgi:hypothetical protein